MLKFNFLGFDWTFNFIWDMQGFYFGVLPFYILLRHIYYFEERKVIKAELIFLLMDLLAWDNTEFAINGKSV